MPEISKQFDFKKREDEIYKLWEKSGFFNPDNLKLPKNAKNYSIIMPPPNVTGVLHMGSAMMLAVEDLLIRYNRMQGKRTLWIPGTDHAAIATQNRVEKNLRKEGLTRHVLGREKFLKKVEEFAENSKKTIIKQMRKMGSSCDWSRLAYTMDETRAKAVKVVFKKMYDDGLIYRGKRVVNWCPRCQSTLANDEVEYKPQKSKLYTFKYDKNFPFAISTTRPETKLGDTAVAVNPKDKRYVKYIGKTIQANFLGVTLELKIISDRSVDMDFGTGALGVTPAHSMVDWQMAQKNDLEIVEVIDENAKIKESFGKFSGHTALEAREMIVEKLKKSGLLEKEEEMENNLSVCYRCETSVEPLQSLQWFINVSKKIARHGKSIKELSSDAVRRGVFGRKKIKILPERFEKNYFNWMDNLEDWCISRQIWFGHRLPVWYRKKSKVESQKSKAAEEYEIYVGEKAPDGKGWVQDEDTLDTWFSSGLWTFSTMAHKPSEISFDKNGIKIASKDFKKFHPTAVLETMYDILFFWVARMIIMTTYNVGDIPFQEVYLHGCVRDKFGDKMSKSKPETNIDPLDVCEKYGTDAVRMSLLIGTTPGSDLRVYDEKIEALRNFITKIWNIYRYSVTTYPNIKLEKKIAKKDIKTLADRWIVSRLHNLTKEVTEDLEGYRFSLAGEKLQNFIWNDLADWYLEISKFEKNEVVLGYVINYVIHLMHPFAPFITEGIYGDMTDKKNILMVAKWPVSDDTLIDKKVEKEFEALRNIISKIRNLRSSYRINPADIIEAGGKKIKNVEIIEKLARVKFEKDLVEELCTTAVSERGYKILLNIYNLIDLPKEKARLQKEIENFEKLIFNMQKTLANKNFVQSAPKEIVAQNKERLQEYQEKLKNQKELLENLK